MFKPKIHDNKKTICLFNKRILGLIFVFTSTSVFLKNNSEKLFLFLCGFIMCTYFTYNMYDCAIFGYACANGLILH